jgi:hypothetical protein
MVRGAAACCLPACYCLCWLSCACLHGRLHVCGIRSLLPEALPAPAHTMYRTTPAWAPALRYPCFATARLRLYPRMPGPRQPHASHCCAAAGASSLWRTRPPGDASQTSSRAPHSWPPHCGPPTMEEATPSAVRTQRTKLHMLYCIAGCCTCDCTAWGVPCLKRQAPYAGSPAWPGMLLPTMPAHWLQRCSG